MENVKEEKSNKHLDTAWIFFIGIITLSILAFIIAPFWLSGILFLLVFLPTLISILIFKWIKKGFATVIFTFSIWLNVMILIIPIFGGLLAIDLMNFSKDFSNQPKYIALQDNNLVFGIDLQTKTGSQFGTNGFSVMTRQQLSETQNEINQKSIKEKIVFIVKKEVFRNIDTVVVKDLGSVPKDTIFDLLKSDDPNKFLIDVLANNVQGIPPELVKQQFSKELGNGDQIKTMALLLLTEATLEKEGPTYFIDELKNGNIKIYPERASLNILIKLLPAELVSSFLPAIPSLSSSEKTRDFNEIKAVNDGTGPQ